MRLRATREDLEDEDEEEEEEEGKAEGRIAQKGNTNIEAAGD